MERRKRRKVLVDKGLQFRFTKVVLFLMLGFGFALGWLVFYLSWSAILTTGGVSETYLQLVRALVWAVVGALVVGGGIGALVSVFISHRVAGPLYRLRLVVQKLVEGEGASPLKLRKKDEEALKGLAEDFNRVLELVGSLREENQKIKTILKEEISRGTPSVERLKALLE